MQLLMSNMHAPQFKTCLKPFTYLNILLLRGRIGTMYIQTLNYVMYFLFFWRLTGIFSGILSSTEMMGYSFILKVLLERLLQISKAKSEP